MKKTFKGSQAAAAARTMPRLVHKPGPEFDWDKSEVFKWLVNQPEIKAYLFSKLSSSGAIVFDPSDNTWRGSDVA